MEPDDCPHTHIGIVSPTPWHLDFMIECADCGGVIEWPTSGVKTFDETRDDIRSWLNEHYPRASYSKSENGA